MRTPLPEEKSREEGEKKNKKTTTTENIILFLHRININTRRIVLVTYHAMEDQQRFEEVSFK
jgi:hypothetical protein